MATALVSAGQTIIGTYVQQDIETRLQQEVYKKQIRVREFFTDFDRLRKGWVTEDKFRSALSMINFHFTRDDIEEIIRRYKLNDGLVQYTTFCNKLEEQFLNSEAKAQVFSAPQIFNQDEEDTVRRLMLAIKRKIATKRIFLKQPFQDFDRTACSHITVDQFSRVLNQLGLLPKDQYLQLLIRQYIDNGNPKEVNYVKFCDDVDNVQEMLSGLVHPDDDFNEDKEGLDLISTLFTSKKLTDNIYTLQKVLKALSYDVIMKRIRIRDILQDFDPLRKDLATESQFARILDIQNIPVSEKEIQILLNQYQVDKMPNGQVDYKQFCQDVDSFFQRQILFQPVFKDFTEKGYMIIFKNFNQFVNNLNEVNYYEFCRIVDQQQVNHMYLKTMLKQLVPIRHLFIRIVNEQRQRITEFWRDFSKQFKKWNNHCKHGQNTIIRNCINNRKRQISSQSTKKEKLQHLKATSLDPKYPLRLRQIRKKQIISKLIQINLGYHQFVLPDEGFSSSIINCLRLINIRYFMF